MSINYQLLRCRVARIQILLLFLLPACNLPDLVVSNVHIAMQGSSAALNCVTSYAPYEVRATVENRGHGLATNIPVVELSTGYAIQIGELPPGQSMEISLPAASSNGAYTISADKQNMITEINEGNNTTSYLAITPTPPASCPPAETLIPPIAVMIAPESRFLSIDALLNGVYRSPDWGEFQLTNGTYYRTPPTSQESPDAYTTRIMDNFIYGDINADGMKDTLGILSTQNGGTGHFKELAAVLNQNGSATIFQPSIWVIG